MHCVYRLCSMKMRDLIPGPLRPIVRALRNAVMAAKNQVAWCMYIRIPEPWVAAYMRTSVRRRDKELAATGHAIQTQMRPRLAVAVDPRVPRQAWAARLEGGVWTIRAGIAVEIRGDALYEGVWAGEFGPFRPWEASHQFGSGLVLEQAWLRCLPPKHPYECLWVLQHSGQSFTVVSNSLAYALVAAGIGRELAGTLAPVLQNSTFAAQAKGMDRADLRVARLNGWDLYRCVYHDVMISSSGHISRRWMPPDPGPRNWHDYESVLVKTVKMLADNGQDASRANRYSLLTSISSGYDSVATAAVARQAGCARAVTLNFRVAKEGRSDSGRSLGEQLGMQIGEYRHVMGEYVRTLALDFDESLAHESAEFVATAGIGDDVAFRPFESQLVDAIFLSGAWGDSIWERKRIVRMGVPLGVPYGKSLGEFRLRVGFVHVPLPTIGGRNPIPIKRLGASRELAPWSVGGDYDRPIARRFAEEAGLQRGTFAAEKAYAAPMVRNCNALFPAAMAAVMSRYNWPGM